MVQIPILYIVVPCYNEEKVLPITTKLFIDELDDLIGKAKVSADSKIMFVDDGSKDDTWKIITDYSKSDSRVIGIRQSRNRGHQNAVLAGLMESMDSCDITISIDCDGQDDITAMEKMVDEYANGSDIVYGVRDSRDTDTFFKRTTAQSFYKMMKWMGAEVVYNHADYRLMSSRALHGLAEYKEVNLFMRGIVPLVGFKSSSVYYSRQERLEGKSHYSFNKMVALALDGMTSFSIKPLQLITVLGVAFSFISFIGSIWAVVTQFVGKTVAGWASMTCILCFLGGIQLISLGVIGTYIGKIYMEVKQRPRYIISDRTNDIDEK